MVAEKVEAAFDPADEEILHLLRWRVKWTEFSEATRVLRCP